jgi:hypothetical protein
MHMSQTSARVSALLSSCLLTPPRLRIRAQRPRHRLQPVRRAAAVRVLAMDDDVSDDEDPAWIAMYDAVEQEQMYRHKHEPQHHANVNVNVSERYLFEFSSNSLLFSPPAHLSSHPTSILHVLVDAYISLMTMTHQHSLFTTISAQPALSHICMPAMCAHAHAFDRCSMLSVQC